MAIKTHHRIGKSILQLVRTQPFRTGVRGVLYLPNGSSVHTLEDKPIAPGVYFLNPDETGKHKNWVIEKELGSRSAGNGRVDVEVHAGNTLRDSDACTLYGLETTKHGIAHSRDAIKLAREHLDRNDDDPRIWILQISEAF